MKEKFTQGEWVAKTGLVGGMKTGLVYIKGGGFDVSGAPDAIANAHLIAAAPDMYRMLEHLEVLVDGVLIDEIRDERSEVLSKARGE